MGQWHSRDLTDFDIVPAVRAAHRASEHTVKVATSAAKEATYVTVGLGLLTYQRAQVRRREIECLFRR